MKILSNSHRVSAAISVFIGFQLLTLGCFQKSGEMAQFLKIGGLGDGSSTVVIKNSALTTSAMSILRNRCDSCHGSASAGLGGYRSSDDAESMVFQGYIIPGDANNSSLIKRCVDNTMPPGSPLSAVDIQTLKTWINTEISIVASSTPGVAPSPKPSLAPPIALAPTYASIRANVLLPKCIACHNAVRHDAGVNVDGYTQTLKYVKLNTPLESKLYKEMANGSMPPPKDINFAAVTQAELKAVYDWILDGSKNN